MRSKLVFGLFGILLIALVACQRQPMQPPAAPSAPAPAPQAAPAPAPAPAAPAPKAEPAAPVKEAKGDVVRDKVVYPTTKGEEPVPTESKYKGKEDSFVASVDCGVQDDKATVSLTVQNPTKGQLMLGDRPQVFENGGEMIGFRLNNRYILDYVECKDYDQDVGIKPGDKVTCMATVPPDSTAQKVLLRHAPTALGNPSDNNLVVYSPSGGREQVRFSC